MSLVVLIDLLAASAAGQERRAYAFLTRVTRFDPDSRFVVLRESGRLPELVLPSARFEIVDVELPASNLKWLARRAWHTFHMRRLIRERAVSVFLTFSHFLPSGVRCARRIVGVSNLAPFSSEAWRLASLPERMRLWLLRRSILASLRRATHVLALSDYCKSLLVRHGVPGASITVVRNGSDSAFLSPLPTKPASPEVKAPFVLSVSHFYSYKNFECVLRAFADLPRDLRATHRLVLVGAPANPQYFQRISSLARSLADQIQVSIIPGLSRESLLPLYANCAAFVFPSLIENSPNVLLEALASGAPCLVSSAQPMPEYAGDAARYFDPVRPEDLASLLAQVLVTPAMRAQLSLRASVVARRFTWDTLVRDTVRAYSLPETAE